MIHTRSMIKYELPQQWISYNPHEVLQELVEAKGAVMSLKTLPYQRRWVEVLQKIQLKLEIAGTSKIEGADFAGNELEVAMRESPEELLTRSQRQAHAAMKAYLWIAKIPTDKPITEDLVKTVHRIIVTDADDDHCEPGRIRQQNQNVTFGVPQHRGCEGGHECADAFGKLIAATQEEFNGHDPLIQALAFHYHFAAMHPFVDGNGRTARAMEALFLQRAGLKDTLFIAMSNFYHDEKKEYLSALSAVRAGNFDLTPFVKFGLRGIYLQSRRLLDLLNTHIKKELFRNLMTDLFHRLKTPRKRVIADRQLLILEELLSKDEVTLEGLVKVTNDAYSKVTNPRKAIIRDLNGLIGLGAIRWKKGEAESADAESYTFFLRLDWPSQITETAFFEKVKKMPTAKDHSFLSSRQGDHL